MISLTVCLIASRRTSNDSDLEANLKILKTLKLLNTVITLTPEAPPPIYSTAIPAKLIITKTPSNILKVSLTYPRSPKAKILKTISNANITVK